MTYRTKSYIFYLRNLNNYEKCFSIIDDAGLCIRQKDASCNVHDQEPLLINICNILGIPYEGLLKISCGIKRF